MSFFAPEPVQKFIEDNQLKKDDEIQIAKSITKNGKTNVVDFKIELLTKQEPKPVNGNGKSYDIKIMLGNDLEKRAVVVKFFNLIGFGTWWLFNQDPEDPYYCWGTCHIFETEVDSFSKSGLVEFRGKFGLGIEKDLYFEEVNAKELVEKLVFRIK